MTRARYRRCPDVLWRRVPGGAVVLPSAAEEPLYLNSSAVLVWELFDAGGTVGDVGDAAAALCGTDGEQLREDVAGIVAYLVGAGTLEVVP